VVTEPRFRPGLARLCHHPCSLTVFPCRTAQQEVVTEPKFFPGTARLCRRNGGDSKPVAMPEQGPARGSQDLSRGLSGRSVWLAAAEGDDHVFLVLFHDRDEEGEGFGPLGPAGDVPAAITRFVGRGRMRI